MAAIMLAAAIIAPTIAMLIVFLVEPAIRLAGN